jgi:phage baseplate assembly protein W
MSTEILSDANSNRVGVTAKVMARVKPYTDLDLRFKPHPNFGDVVPLKDIAAIKNSIRTILLTNKGERPFQPNFGCNISGYLFEQPDPITLSFLEDEIKDALGLYEPRVITSEVKIQDNTDANALFVSVSCILISTQQEIDVELFLERTR